LWAEGCWKSKLNLLEVVDRFRITTQHIPGSWSRWRAVRMAGMRHLRSRLVSCMTLAAFLVVDGFALARTLSQTCRCQVCSELGRLRAYPGSDEASIACCDDCRLPNVTETAAEPSKSFRCRAVDVIRPSCPCQNHQCPACPCPGGCGYCSVAKVPCTGQATDLIAAASPFQWNLLDLANCYSSPCHANSTPPPRA
jgi:hypothetical protein